MSGNTNNINKESWDKYQDDYMKFHLMRFPDYYESFSNGGVWLDGYLIDMLGDVKGLRLLDTCCACDAKQAFSWHNLGAKVTANDITPSAIRIAKENANKMNLAVDFSVDDMQTLSTINDDEYDIVFATYPVWLSDMDAACLTWHRVLKKGGKLLLHAEHPITYCVDESEGKLSVLKNYNKPSIKHYDRFDGTPLANGFGGWSVDLPSVENFWRISDMLNAICKAGFNIREVHESSDNPDDNTILKNMPDSFAVLAIK